MNPNRLRKILFFSHAQALGGAELSLLDILANLDRKQFEPLLLAPGAGPLTVRARDCGIEIRTIRIPESILGWRKDSGQQGSWRLAAAGLSAISAVLRLARLLRAEKPDILYTNSQKAHVLGGLAGKLAGVPVVWHFRDILQQRELGTLVNTLGRWLPRRIVAVSQAVANQFRAPGLQEKLSVIPNGIDIGSLRAMARATAPAKVRKQTGIPLQAPLVGLVGRIAPWKGQKVFIEAARIISAELPTAQFIIAGGPLFGEHGYARELETLAGARGLENKLLFTGHLENVYPVMAILDVLVHCSVEPEPFGRAVAEAMALGVPVAAGRCGAMPELIDDGRDGLLVEPADARALASAVIRILGDPILTRKLRTNGPRKIESKFEVQRTVRSIESMLNQLIDDK